MAGRRPKPNILKMVTGNPGGRPLNDAEPQPPKGWPPMPPQLGEAGQAEWRRLAKLLEDELRLTLSDGPSLEGAAMAYEKALEYDRRGKNPKLPAAEWRRYQTGARVAWEAYRKWLNDMCLSAGTRSRVKQGGRGAVGGKLTGFLTGAKR